MKIDCDEKEVLRLKKLKTNVFNEDSLENIELIKDLLSSDDKDMVLFLLKNFKFNETMKGEDGKSIDDLLEEYENNEKFDSIGEDEDEIIEYLKKNKDLDLNLTLIEDKPLIFYAIEGYDDLVDYLLSEGVNVNIKHEDETIFDQDSFFDGLEEDSLNGKILLKGNTDFNIKVYNGDNIIMHIVKHRWIKDDQFLMKLVKEKEFDIEHRNDNNESLLHIVLFQGYKKLMSYLIQQKVKLYDDIELKVDDTMFYIDMDCLEILEKEYDIKKIIEVNKYGVVSCNRDPESKRYIKKYNISSFS